MGVHHRRDRLAAAIPAIALWLIFGAMTTVAISALVPAGATQAYVLGAAHATLTVLALLGHRHLHHVLTTPDAQLALLREELVADGQITPPVSLYRTW